MSFESSFISILWIHVLYQMCDLQVVFLSPGLLFIFLISFEEQNLKFLMKFNLPVFFSFVGCAFSVVSKKSLPNPRSQRFSLIFSSRSFTVLGFIVRYI